MQAVGAETGGWVGGVLGAGVDTGARVGGKGAGVVTGDGVIGEGVGKLITVVHISTLLLLLRFPHPTPSNPHPLLQVCEDGLYVLAAPLPPVPGSTPCEDKSFMLDPPPFAIRLYVSGSLL